MDSGVDLKNNNPIKSANIFSKLFFTWMIKLYRKGTDTGIEVADLYKVLEYDSSQKLGDELEKNWNNERTRAKLKDEQPKLLKALTKTFFWNYMIWGGILFIQHVGLRTIQPVILSYLISQFSESNNGNTSQMYISASLLVGISILVILTMHHSNFGQASIGMRIRIGVSSLLYRKTLKLSKKSLGQTSVGKVVNLLSNDVTRFDLVMLMLHYLWIMPFQASLITYLTWQQVQISCLVGVLSVTILSLPVQGYLGKLTSNFRLKVAQRTDYRVTLMSEIISGIQVIKMYAWEKPFDFMVRLARGDEVKALTLASYLRGIYLSFMIFVERVALFLTTVTYVLLGNVILAEQVFSLAQFFNLLQLTMAIFYPMSISYGAETLVAIDRLQEFLLLEENEESLIEKDPTVGVVMKDINASWKPEILTLRGINLEIPVGALCVIIGPVGSGKSSLLQILLGELPLKSGNLKIQGNVAYATQEPWLFASTIRNNILFGQEFDRILYQKIVKACALQKDLEQLPSGDKTLVGERGAALSGGQKARVSLARAIYRDADIYLLDDPLSAVDPHVGKHLFEKCILRHLRNKTRILVTHQLQFLKKADLIIYINEGRIEAQGTYDQLREQNLNFTNVLGHDHEQISAPEKDLTAEATIEMHRERRSSFLLSTSLFIESVNIGGDPVINEEEITPSGSGSSPLIDYIKSSGNCLSISSVVLLMLLSQIACSSSDYWVTFWTQQESLKSLNRTELSESGSNLFVVDTYLAIYVYTCLIVAAAALTVIRSLTYFKLAMNASRNLHNRMFSALIEAPMKFFNTNPAGRILNRFSKDMGAVDEILPKVLLESIQISLIMVGILIMVVISNVYMIFAIIVLGFFFIKLRSLFITTSKNIKHLEGITKSPMFSHLNSSLNGITTIRAFNAEEMLKKEFDDHQDTHTSAWFMTITCMVSFGLWLDIICVTFIACTTFSFIILNYYGQVSGSLVGLAISQSLILTGMLQYGIRQTAEVINQLTSVERITHYINIDREGPFETWIHNVPQNSWPSRGLLQVKELYLQYSLEEPPVLKDLNFKVKPGQKIGIVGRTGAGKSSLISALFRLTDFNGTIHIDGIDTKSLGLHDLRSKISIIPQEPVLFSASLRFNLDPFNDFGDDKLWEVLEEVELKDVSQNLNVMVVGGGRNFSVGQRQLICLARAILRNNKILILDEATANIDQNTDALIQETIRKKFRNCTVLTVAHRLNTIMDSDKVIAMEGGKIMEYDYPYKLLQNSDSIFYQMVIDTGSAMSVHLEDMALDAFLHKRLNDDD